jgi:hypothetical protein
MKTKYCVFLNIIKNKNKYDLFLLFSTAGENKKSSLLHPVTYPLHHKSCQSQQKACPAPG